jgi:hypothetical protein
MRGHRPSSCNVIEADAATVSVRAWVFEAGAFRPGPQEARLPRRGVAPRPEGAGALNPAASSPMFR